MISDHLDKMRSSLTDGTKGFRELLTHETALKVDIDNLDQEILAKQKQLFELTKAEESLEIRRQELKDLEIRLTQLNELETNIKKDRALLEKEKEALDLRGKQLQAKEVDLNHKAERINQILGS